MQLITTQNLLDLGISEDKHEALLAHLNEQLEERIGIAITDLLDDQQVATLLDIQETGTDEQVDVWLQQHIPNMEEIVQDEVAILLGELAENSDTISEIA